MPDAYAIYWIDEEYSDRVKKLTEIASSLAENRSRLIDKRSLDRLEANVQWRKVIAEDPLAQYLLDTIRIWLEEYQRRLGHPVAVT